MDSGFTAERRRRLVEVILQAMKEGWSPGSDAANDGAWKDKQAEARFASAFKELVEPEYEQYNDCCSDHWGDPAVEQQRVFLNEKKRQMSSRR